MLRNGTVKRVGNHRVDVQLSGSTATLKNVKVSSQISWDMIQVGSRVLVDLVDNEYVVLHTFGPRPTFYASNPSYTIINRLSGSADNVLLADGSVPLVGNLPVADGVTIDGYDISILGETISNLQAADTISKTGYTVFTHSTYLTESIDATQSTIYVADNIFESAEWVALSSIDGYVEFMRINEKSTPIVRNNRTVYSYPVTRAVATSPGGGSGRAWAMDTLVPGLTLKGWISVDGRHNRDTAPSLRVSIWENAAASISKRIFQVGSLNNTLGLPDGSFGFAVGNLTDADRYMLYENVTGTFQLMNVDLVGLTSSNAQAYRIYGTFDTAEGRYPGDFTFGTESGGNLNFSSNTGHLSLNVAGEEFFIMNPDYGAQFRKMVWSGFRPGPQVGIGVNDEGNAEIVARNRAGVYQFDVVTGEDDVFVHIGNPSEIGNYIEFKDGVLTVNGIFQVSDNEETDLGGWVVRGSSLQTMDGSAGMASIQTGLVDLRHWVGSNLPNDAPFRIYDDGRTYIGELSVTDGIGFFSTNAITQRTVTGATLSSKLDSVILALDSYGLINDVTTASPEVKTIVFVVPGDLTVGSVPIKVHAPQNMLVTNVTATVNTAPTGADLIIDVNKEGTTMFTTQANRPTIAISGTEDMSSVPDVTSITQDDIITIDIDQVGSTVKGADLVIEVRCTVY